MKPPYSMRRGYRVLYLHCARCEKEQPFYRINSWPTPQKKVVRRVDGKAVVLPSQNQLPDVPPEARLISATCMICDHTAQYVGSTQVLAKSRYALGDLCSCGLPVSHTGKHLEELRARAS